MPTPILRTCNGCGAKCTTTPCPRCRPGRKLTYNDNQYQRNRHIILANARVCAITGLPPTATDPLTCDHIIALSAGGTHELKNLRPVLASVNKSRGATGGRPHPGTRDPATLPASAGDTLGIRRV